MIKDILRRLRELEAKVERLTPVRTPGTITTQTTRGTSVRPIGRTTKSGSSDEGRWA
jgi:hypothetical protein